MNTIATVDTQIPVAADGVHAMVSPMREAESAQAVRAALKCEDKSETNARLPVESLVKELNDNLKVFNSSLSFTVDKDTGKTVVKVLDSTTNTVIRQIPTEEMLKIAARIKDLLGVLYDKTR